MFKEIVILSCVASIALAYPPHHAENHHEAPANYDFNYEVHEISTGDIKRQTETAKDGHISGEYSLVEPDGIYRRIVTYTADDEHGFKVSRHWLIAGIIINEKC